MEFIKTVLMATCLVTLASVVSSIPLPGFRTVNDLQSLVLTHLHPRVNNTIAEMQRTYPFIATSADLQVPVINLGLDNGSDCSPSQGVQSKLSEVFTKLYVFRGPLHMAYSYEHAQGPQHDVLAYLLNETSRYVNVTIAVVAHEMQVNSFPLPSFPHPLTTEAEFDSFTRQYLQILSDRGLTITITDDLVKIYRNYVINYTLRDVIKFSILPCIAGI